MPLLLITHHPSLITFPSCLAPSNSRVKRKPLAKFLSVP
jgi:hypothetical protein